MDHLHWRHLLAKPLATVTHDSHMTTWLGHLGQSDRDRIISVCHITQGSQVCRCHVLLLPALSSDVRQCKHGFRNAASIWWCS